MPPLTFEETVAALVFSDYSDVRALTAPTDRLSPQIWVTNVPNPGNKEYL